MHYKVVLNDGGRLYSSHVRNVHRVEYLAGQFVSASIGKLFIFVTQSLAEEWIAGDRGDLEVWRCEARGVESIQSALSIGAVDAPAPTEEDVLRLKTFWRGDLFGPAPPRTKSMTVLAPVKGTVVADSVRLLQRIVPPPP